MAITSPLVEYLRNQGKQVEVMAFGNTLAASGRLKEVADDFTDLGGDKAKFLIQIADIIKNVKKIMGA